MCCEFHMRAWSLYDANCHSEVSTRIRKKLPHRRENGDRGRAGETGNIDVALHLCSVNINFIFLVTS